MLGCHQSCQLTTKMSPWRLSCVVLSHHKIFPDFAGCIGSLLVYCYYGDEKAHYCVLWVRWGTAKLTFLYISLSQPRGLFWEALVWSWAADFGDGSCQHLLRVSIPRLEESCQDCFHPSLEHLDNGQRSENTWKSFVPWSLKSSLESSGQQQVLR